MKKVKITAMILALAILLPFMPVIDIPAVSADEPAANEVANLAELLEAINEANNPNGTVITLTKIITITANDGVAGAVTLNGTDEDGTDKNITILRGAGVTGNLFSVNTGGSLTLKNITLDGNNGVVTNAGGSLVRVTGGTFTMLDGAVLQNNSYSGSAGGVYVNGTFTMTGGKIINNTSNSSSGGVYVGSYSTFTMTGGKIINNTSSDSSRGGGVYMSSGTFTLGGKAVIKDNLSVGKVSNVYLYSGKYITLGTGANGCAAPATGMEVWVQTATANGVIVNSDAAPGSEQFFKSDISSREIIHNNGQLIIKGKTGDLWGEFQNDILDYATATEDMTITVSGPLTADCVITIPAPQTTGVTLTIKGKDDAVITRGEGVIGGLFTVPAGVSLTLKNITLDGNNGVVTNAGGSLVQVIGGTFTMLDGAVLQNNSSGISVGGVYVGSGTFTMTGGKIINNTSDYSYFGGGVYVNGTFTLGGTAIIKDNLNTGKVSNVYLDGGKYITLGTGDNAPKAGMDVSVQTATANNGVIVDSGATPGSEQFFKSDISSREIIHNNGQLIIKARSGDPWGEIQNKVLDYATATDDIIIEVSDALTADCAITIPAPLTPGITLTIKGKDDAVITRGEGVTGGLFNVDGGSLTLQDITLDGNKGVGNNAGGSLVYVNDGTFTMLDGAVLQNNSGGISVGGVYVGSSGTFTMTGGKIINNTSSNSYYGGGVDVYGTFTLGGTAIIKDNLSEGLVSNVYLNSGNYITLGTDENAPADGMEVGVQTLTASGVFVDSGAALEHVRYFVSDDATKGVMYEADGKLVLTENKIGGSVTIDGTAEYGQTLTATPSVTSTEPGGLSYQWKRNGDVIAGADVSTYTLTADDIGAEITVEVMAANYGGRVSATVTVPKITLTPSIVLTGVTGKVYDGTTAITGTQPTITLTGALLGETPTATVTSFAFNSKNVGDNKTVTATGITLTSLSDRYELSAETTSTSSSLSITAKALTVNVEVEDKVYDGTDKATISSLSLVGVADGDDVKLNPVTATFSSLNAGVNIPINFTDFTISGADAGNYTLTQPASVTANITKGSGLTSVTTTLLNISVSDTDEHEFDLLTMLNKTDYGNISYAKGTLTGDTGILSKAELIGSKLTYQVSGTTTGTATQQVTITTDNYKDVTVSITFTVTNKTDVSGSISFGDGEATYSGAELEYKEATCTVTGGTITYTYAVSTETPTAKLGDNGKPLTVGKYTVTATYEDDDSIGSKTVNFTVKPKLITVNVTIADKPYDGTYAATISSLSLVDVEGDDDVDVTHGAATFTSLNVGTNIPISFTEFTLTGDDAFNYILTQPTGVKANITQQGNTPVYGDVDGKDGVTQVDVIALKRWLARWSVIIVDINADVNGDGSINDIDVVILKRYLAGWNIKLGK